MLKEAILKDAHTRGPEFLLYTGDPVTLGSLQEEWDAWFAAGKSVLPSLPTFFIHGNHEANQRHYYAQLEGALVAAMVTLATPPAVEPDQ